MSRNGTGRRRALISRWVSSGLCTVLLDEGRVVGYAALEYSFYENGFVGMLYVEQDHRRRGGASTLMRHLEATCRTPKLFTSTNLSNTPMQSLLTKLQYTLAGIIHYLDEDDPELVYVKWLGERQGPS